jgi:Ca2+-transporting ATPase
MHGNPLLMAGAKADFGEGLSSQEAAALLVKYGPNELRERKRQPAIVRFIMHFADFLVLLLLAAAGVALLLGETLDAAMISAIVLMQAVLGFAQEYKAEKSFDALKRMVSSKALCLRDGRVEVLDARSLVPGDVVLLEAGDRVPADGQVIQSFGLAADEAALTGESVPVDKRAGRDSAWMGTVVAAGKGRMRVAGTGMSTRMGKISEMAQAAEKERTPVEKDLERMGKQLGTGVLALCALVFLSGLLRGFAPLGMFLTSVSLAVAAIPEGLPAVVVITLAIGVQRMSARNAIVKKLKSVETLGCADVICTDKTGTLTRNEMTVRKVLLAGEAVDVSGSGYEPRGAFSSGGAEQAKQSAGLRTLMEIGALCNNAYLREEGGGWRVIGDPTEGALLVLAAKAGMWKERMEQERKALMEFPFDSERKMMAVVRKAGAGQASYVKGAPESVLVASTMLLENGRQRKLTERDRKRIRGEIDSLAAKGYRTLALAYRKSTSAAIGRESAEKGLTFVGIAAMMDSPREEVRGALELCRSAGIRVIMITGDHPLTARAIARELSIGNGEAATGEELDRMGEAELGTCVERVSVYARVSPGHKLRIVEALNRNGHVVAMTGDGVNDAPALRKADIGVAMGITGTEVAKESADMVLADDNFVSIVAAVEEGRGVYANIKKTLAYLLSGNMAEVGIVFIAVMLGLPLPLIAIQILWINLVTDGLPAIALAMDPAERGVMERKPRQRGESIWKGTGMFVLEAPALVTACALGGFAFLAGQGDLVLAQSVVFTTIVLSEAVEAFCARSLEKPALAGVLGNRWLVYVTIITLALQALIIYSPAMNALFHVEPLGVREWAIALGSALLVFAYLEARKWQIRQKKP